MEFNDVQKKILQTLLQSGKPVSGKEVGETSGVEAAIVGREIKKLKDKGFVDGPERCKYGITEAGKKSI